VVENFNESDSRSWKEGGHSANKGQQVSRGSGLSYNVGGRALLQPDEVLRLSDDYLIAFQRGMAPILAKRIKWYQDPAFRPAAAISGKAVARWVLLAATVALVVGALIGK
jgi:type IV secretory pathway TraG/TraD family ATPase VirD4